MPPVTATPGDKQLALIARRPELGLDFDYIATGRSCLSGAVPATTQALA